MIEIRIAPAAGTLVSRGFNKDPIELIRDCETADRELVNKDAVNRTFVFRARVTAHQELSGAYDEHLGFDA
jgi:hypothetical protein